MHDRAPTYYDRLYGTGGSRTADRVTSPALRAHIAALVDAAPPLDASTRARIRAIVATADTVVAA